MTNNQLCNLLTGAGALVTFLSAVAIFFGAGAWLGAGLGILTCALGLANYES